MAIPSYFMQSMLIPKALCEEIECMVHRFVCRSSNSGRKVVLVGWEDVCQPREHGDLNFRKL